MICTCISGIRVCALLSLTIVPLSVLTVSKARQRLIPFSFQSWYFAFDVLGHDDY